MGCTCTWQRYIRRVHMFTGMNCGSTSNYYEAWCQHSINHKEQERLMALGPSDPTWYSISIWIWIRLVLSGLGTSKRTSTNTCNICEYEYKYEYLIITWVQVRVRVLVDEYEYKCEYRPMIYILYKKQYCILQSLKRESSDSYKPGAKLQLPIVHVNSLCQYIYIYICLTILCYLVQWHFNLGIATIRMAVVSDNYN